MPAQVSSNSFEVILLFLLVAIALFAGVAERIKVPYPILLVVAGLGFSFMPHVPHIPLRPDLVFAIFLPPLLYAAAWQTNWRDFRRNLFSISMLAVGLVGFTVFGIAMFADHFITALDFRSGFLLGAVVAATDAVAASSIATKLGLSPRTTAVLGGESLLNDATALLALEFGIALLLGQKTPSFGEGLARLAWLIAGGIGVGLLLGKAVSYVERWIDSSEVEMVVSLVVPYVAYLVGEEVHASGVLAVVVCGLFLSKQSSRYLSAPARLEILAGWKALDFLLNGAVFVVIGLQLPEILQGIRGDSLGTLLKYGIGFSLLLLLLRMVWVFAGSHFSYVVRAKVFHKDAPKPDGKSIFITGWAGMRGVVALAAAYSVPYVLPNGAPFAQRNLIIFLTFAVILFSLVVQGLSLPWLIRKLGLDGSREVLEEELNARCRVLSSAIGELKRLRNAAAGDEGEEHDIDDMLHRYEHRLEALRAKQSNVGLSQKPIKESENVRHRRRADLLRNAVTVERETLFKMREEDAIGDDVWRRLERELDLTETRYESFTDH
ncbi:MAG: Na+/H+ antiporter [Acidobacteriaceae bacterium]|nr:Na+/H+ antiporter [Acidobacteriaceae bacterium]